MDDEKWHLWQERRRGVEASSVLRYGLAVALPLAAAYFVHRRTVFAEAPFLIFLVPVVLCGVWAGLGPALVSTALSAVLQRLLFVGPESGVFFDLDLKGMEPRVMYVLLAVLLSLSVAGLRRERDQSRDNEERYRMLAESAPDAIIVIDERGEILYLNPAAEQTFATRAEVLRGRNLNLLLPGDHYQAQLGELKQNLDTRKRPVAVKLPGLSQGGEHLQVAMTVGTAYHRGRSVFTAILRDITTPASQP